MDRTRREGCDRFGKRVAGDHIDRFFSVRGAGSGLREGCVEDDRDYDGAERWSAFC